MLMLIVRLKYNNSNRKKSRLKKATRNKIIFRNKIKNIIRKYPEILIIIIFSKQEYFQT